MDKIFQKYFVMPRIKYLVTWKNIFRVSWMNDIYKWKCVWKMTMDELLHENSQQVLFCKKLNKRNMIKEIYVGLLWTIFTWNVQVIFELVFHILVLQHPNHIKFEITSNSITHKPIDPLRGTCLFKHHLSTTKSYVTIRNWNNIRYPKTPYHLKTF